MSNEIIEAIKKIIEFVNTKPSPAKSSKYAAIKVFQEFEDFLALTEQEFTEDKALYWAEMQSASHTHGAYYRHNICMLIDYLHGIPLEHNKIYGSTLERHLNISEEWNEALTKYLQELKRELKAADTIQFSKSASMHFIKYVEAFQCYSPKQLTRAICNEVNQKFEFCSTLESKKAYLYKVRLFIRFLQREYDVNPVMEYSIITRIRIPHKLVTVLEPEQTLEISNHRESSTQLEARDYAMVMLARYLGLRERDICFLKFSNIDWKANTIKLVQQKTKVEIILPLIPCVGNALMNYIIKFRPLSNSDYIFVSQKYPHTALSTRGAAYMASRHIITIRPDGQHSGLHIMRRTLASDMLRCNIKHEIVSAALGHTSPESIDPYIRIHAESLMKCSLSTEQFGIPEVLR